MSKGLSWEAPTYFEKCEKIKLEVESEGLGSGKKVKEKTRRFPQCHTNRNQRIPEALVK